LAALGHDVAAMVRNIQTAARRLPPGIALRAADYEDVPALRSAFAGIDRLVLISSDGDACAVMRHHANAIEAAMAADIRHIVFTSIVDIDAMSPFYFSPAYRDAERRLAACDVPSTVLRCGLYSDFILQHWLAPIQMSGELALPTGHGRVAVVSRDDVAVAVAAAAVKSDESRRIYRITGHWALSFDEIAASYAEAIARPVRYRPCLADEYRTGASMRLDDPWPYAFTTLCASIAEERYSQVSEGFAALTGREPESFQSFLLRATSGHSASGDALG
jgi:NAD(P)H dehydrogenase (quinone)